MRLETTRGMRRCRFAAPVVAMMAVAAPSPSAFARTTWPGKTTAAIVLTYDDALESQLATVVPTLNAAALKATFILSGVRQADVARWRRVGLHGHELGNHTIFHVCPAKAFPANPRYTTEAYSPASMLKEIADLATDAAIRCSRTRIRRKHHPRTTYRLRARGRGRGGIAVLLFRGVGGDHLQVPVEAHRMLLDWLHAYRREVWTTTLEQALDWERTHQVGKSVGRPVTKTP